LFLRDFTNPRVGTIRNVHLSDICVNAPGRLFIEGFGDRPVEQVVLLRQGRISAAGPKAQVLTGEHLSLAFGAPLAVEESVGYFQARV
jgi:hypothetical protein